jgi:hypothetical protein
MGTWNLVSDVGRMLDTYISVSNAPLALRGDLYEYLYAVFACPLTIALC